MDSKKSLIPADGHHKRKKNEEHWTSDADTKVNNDSIT